MEELDKMCKEFLDYCTDMHWFDEDMAVMCERFLEEYKQGEPKWKIYLM